MLKGVKKMHYPNIDIKKTGKHLQQLIKESKYSVKQIQEYLYLSCPQPIYRWFKGQILPSLNHMYALSLLLGVPMEELIVINQQDEIIWTIENMDCTELKRYLLYYIKLNRIG